jgi:hypothetical protein
MTEERDVSGGTTPGGETTADTGGEGDLAGETAVDAEVTGGTTRHGDLVGEAVRQRDLTDETAVEGDVTREPHWSPRQLETDDGGPEPDRVDPGEMTGGIRGGGGATWNKGSMEFDEQETIPPAQMKESEKGPWGTADQGERAEGEHPPSD